MTKEISEKMKNRQVIVMKGQETIAEGTVTECAEKLNVLDRTIYWYSTEAYQRKLSKVKSLENRRMTVFMDEDDE